MVYQNCDIKLNLDISVLEFHIKQILYPIHSKFQKNDRHILSNNISSIILRQYQNYMEIYGMLALIYIVSHECVTI